MFEVERSLIANGVPLSALLAEHTKVFASKGELRRLVQGGGLSLNKEKEAETERVVNTSDLLGDKYILVQKGKKNYSIIKIKG